MNMTEILLFLSWALSMGFAFTAGMAAGASMIANKLQETAEGIFENIFLLMGAK